MGSIHADLSKKDITVLITGFAPFKEEYPKNPSWEIVRSLPDYLPPIRAKTTSIPPKPLLPPVRLLIHPEPIHVSYETVSSLVPTLHSTHNPTFTIHVGMAGPRAFYCIERRGHRDGYKMQDVDGHFLAPEEEFSEELPNELETEFDVEDVLRRWKDHSPKYTDLRISEDAGHFLCDFIYFSSLSLLWKGGKERKCLFLHVPSDTSEGAVERGRELLLQLVRGIVESEVEKEWKKEDQ
ncbi:putative pyroglutamyl peptidase [Podospora fimiseda]|uniref:Pyroglutamyl peptidase n=1 Tax=Podospora fimiseda TaxID=252190 RepID=A0AAN7BT94_9PEZI|nr:putative pyroglutamyl peptidase [Podospora fimiseda]